jgi:hypothetical protein
MRMTDLEVFILLPLIGYVGLWILGSALFLVYFKLFHISIDLKHTVTMIQKVPAFLAILTVPLCSFTAFFITTKLLLRASALSFDATKLLQVGIISLVCTIVLDLAITVVGEKINILAFPVNLMYLFAWLVIIPAVVLAGQ